MSLVCHVLKFISLEAPCGSTDSSSSAGLGKREAEDDLMLHVNSLGQEELHEVLIAVIQFLNSNQSVAFGTQSY